MRDADLTPTGRELKDPACTLVECVDSNGLKHTVLAYDEPFVGHDTLTTGVDLIMSFMAYPMVTGLVECTAADTRRARFAYPTGTIWTVKEIARGFEQVGQSVGVRAALELCYLSGMVLHEAGETGPLQGCFSHGNLNPWRIGMKGDGQLQVFGYGLAQVEMSNFIQGKSDHIDLDSIRYAPPERLESQPEQPSSDIYSLAVIAFELMTGKPLYTETDSQAMWNAVKLAEGVQRIATSKLPSSVQDLLGSALLYDPDRRLQGPAFVEEVGRLLDDPAIDGRTLAEVMERMGNQGTRSKRKLVKATATSAFTPEALAALAAEEEDEGDQDEAQATGEKRWSSLKGEATTGRRTVRRGRGAPVAEPEAKPTAAPEPRRRKKKKSNKADKGKPAAASKQAAPAPEAAEPPPRTRRRSTATQATVVPAAPPDTANEPPKEDAQLAETPRRRRRRRTEPGDTPPAEQPTASASTDEEPPTRRRRRTVAPADDAKAPAAEAVAEEPPRRRRRRRTESSEVNVAEAAEAPKASNDSSKEPAADPSAPTPPPEPRRRRRRKPDTK